MLLSIITVNYNNLLGLKKTSESVFSQTCQEFEWLIIDGGSTDGSKEYLQSIRWRCTFACSERDGGIYEGMNKGISHATGLYLYFLNSGDSFYSVDSVKMILRLLNCSYDIIRCGVSTVKGNIMPTKYITGLYLFTQDIAHQGTVIRRSLLCEKNYDTQYRVIADMHFFRWAYMIKQVKDLSHKQIIANYDTTGISSIKSELKYDERKRSWIELFGKIVYEDYKRLAYGNSFSEKCVAKARTSQFCTVVCSLCLLPAKAAYVLWNVITHMHFFLHKYFNKH